MNSIGHFVISVAKSLLRLTGCVLAITHDIRYGFILFGVAEILGIAEELVDKR